SVGHRATSRRAQTSAASFFQIGIAIVLVGFCATVRAHVTSPMSSFMGFTYYCRPMLRQRLAATDREHPLADVMKNTRCHRYFRLSNPAHNGLVGGSSPPGPPASFSPIVSQGFFALFDTRAHIF